MSYAPESVFQNKHTFAAQASVDARADFINKTYMHLAGAIFAFVALEVLIFKTPALLTPILSVLTIPYGFLLLMGGFILVSYIAEGWARSSTSPGMQYAGLGLYVVAEAVIFAPLLFLANGVGANVIPIAGIMTLTVFTGLTAVVFVTRKNFSFLAPALSIGGFAALGAIICFAFLGGANIPGLSLLFSVAMVVLASGYILYQTSQILHEYRIGQHVAASLALFASVALLFWYILRIVMSSRD